MNDKIFTTTDLKPSYGGTDRPQSEAVYDYVLYATQGKGTFSQWMAERCRFESEDEVEAFANAFALAVLEDPYMSYDGRKMQKPVIVQCLYKRFNDVMTRFAQSERWAKALATQLWNEVFARQILNERVEKLIKKDGSGEVFDEAFDKIARVYSLSDVDMDKIWFFVMQVKNGNAFPNSLRRMLYFWGRNKRTGKTTTARTIVSILNGETNIAESYRFETSLSNEMQIGSFKVPIISRCNCAMMDECFYADMGKTYADFKRFLTSNNGRARLPYGQEFEWKGNPNYIATSNEPLKTFIKDWQDRRYLSIEFKGTPEQMMFEDISKMWLDFIRNAAMPVGENNEPITWQEWTADLDRYANEDGERTIMAEEYRQELMQSEFQVYAQTDYNAMLPRTANNNRKTLKWFVDYFARKDSTARVHRTEIEQAVREVFGERYKDNYWLLGDIITRIML